MRKKKSSTNSRRKRVRGGAGAVPTRRAASQSSKSRSTPKTKTKSKSRSMSTSTSASMSKKMLSVSKYVTILNKLFQSKAIKKNDPLAGYILVPFVDSYSGVNTKDSSAASQSQSRRRSALTVRGGASLRAAASIADEPEAAIPSENNILDLLLRHGRSVLGLHGPCWWHRINH